MACKTGNTQHQALDPVVRFPLSRTFKTARAMTVHVKVCGKWVEKCSIENRRGGLKGDFQKQLVDTWRVVAPISS